MFNSKLKKQIESLEDRICKQNNRIMQLEWDYKILIDERKTNNNHTNWRFHNPPKYKVGSKVDKVWIVTSFEFMPANRWQCSSKYQYTLTNIKTGETKTI